jgi:hypothetical protein
MLCLVATSAQDEKPIQLDDLLLSARLPPGYQSTSEDVKLGDKKTPGKRILVSKPDVFAKAVVMIEGTDRSTVPARRAATKGYINGLAQSMAGIGYKIVEQKIPDIAEEKFEKPISISFVVANGEGKKLWVHEEIFFTDKGFLIQVIAEDPDTLAQLVKWAKTVKPK